MAAFGNIFKALMGPLGGLVDAIDRVAEKGITETVDLRMTILGRRIGIKSEVSLLDVPEPKSATAAQPGA